MKKEFDFFKLFKDLRYVLFQDGSIGFVFDGYIYKQTKDSFKKCMDLQSANKSMLSGIFNIQSLKIVALFSEDKHIEIFYNGAELTPIKKGTYHKKNNVYYDADHESGKKYTFLSYSFLTYPRIMVKNTDSRPFNNGQSIVDFRVDSYTSDDSVSMFFNSTKVGFAVTRIQDFVCDIELTLNISVNN